MLRRGSRLIFSSAVAIAAHLPGIATAQVYSDATLELSASGSAGGRSCTAVLKPKQTLGDAPRLVLTTGWLAELSFGLVGPEQLQNSVIVQNNLRRPFAGATNISSERIHDPTIRVPRCQGEPTTVKDASARGARTRRTAHCKPR